MKSWFIFFTVTCYVHLYSQDSSTAIVVDENLIVSLPFPFNSSTKGHFINYTSTSENIEFIVSKEFSYPGDESKEEFKNSMYTFLYMFDSIEQFNDYIKEPVDTIIGGTHGLYVSVRNIKKIFPLTKLYAFHTTKDSFSYTFYAKLRGNDSGAFEEQVKWFFDNIHFSKDYYSTLPEKIADVKRRKVFGQIIGWIFVLAALAYLTYSHFKKKITI